MNVQPNEEQAIVARVEKLERENTRLKRVGAAVMLIGSMVVLMGQAKPAASKQADDAKAKRLAIWQRHPNHWHLLLLCSQILGCDRRNAIDSAGSP